MLYSQLRILSFYPWGCQHYWWLCIVTTSVQQNEVLINFTNIVLMGHLTQLGCILTSQINGGSYQIRGSFNFPKLINEGRDSNKRRAIFFFFSTIENNLKLCAQSRSINIVFLQHTLSSMNFNKQWWIQIKCVECLNFQVLVECNISKLLGALSKLATKIR